MFWWLPVIQHKVFVWAFWRAEQFANMRVLRLWGLRLVMVTPSHVAQHSCMSTLAARVIATRSSSDCAVHNLFCFDGVQLGCESSRMGNSPDKASCPYVVVRLWGPRFVLVAFSAIRLIALKALSHCPLPTSDYEHTRYKLNENKRRRLLVFG